MAFGQRNDRSGMDLKSIVLANQRESYITFPVDIGNIEPLMFEANVNPSFVVRKREDSRLLGLLTSQIVIRMYNEASYPIRTPSFIPQLSAYYQINEPQSTLPLTLFGKLAHHSNGQNGSFYNVDGSVNLSTGNFATNFLEFGLLTSSFSTALNANKFFKTSFEIHPKSWMLDELQGGYSGLRWHNGFYAYKLPVRMGHEGAIKANFSIKLETTWFMDSINAWDPFTIKRLTARLLFYYHPDFLEEVGFFIELYHGTDYYNIYFQRRIDMVRFGIMTDVLRF